MFTLRSRWLLASAVMLIVFGLVIQTRPILTLLGLSLLLWITAEGLLFTYRVRCVVRNLRLKRTVRDNRGPVASFWVGRPFEVHLQLTLDNGYIPYLKFDEPAAFGLEITSGQAHGEGSISSDQPLEVRYHVKAARTGCIRFEGVRVQLADLHGLFYHVAFVRLEELYRVLPTLVDAEGKTASAKRYNMLPPPGIHRLHRPGSGSELLDLRDYMPGDPPKTIAWKVSARRDRLITKEFESEVPIRCTLFIDTSQSVRIGPPGRNALTRLIEIASGVAQANLSSRDMTGLCLFDEEKTRILKPARTRRHLVEVFNQLADAAALAPGGSSASVELHLRLAYTFAQEVYPEQLDDSVNHMPGWLTFFSRTPSRWVTPTTWPARLYRWIFGGVAAAISLLALFAALVAAAYFYVNVIPEAVHDEELVLPFDYIALAIVVLYGLALPIWMILWCDALPLLFSPRKRRLTRMRKKMAALLSSRYQLGGGGLELLFQDDLQLSLYLERFLNDHHVPHTPQLFDKKGRYLFASPLKIDVLSTALLRSIGKGHDNELFVLFVDVVELGEQLDPLIKAIKVALARHHQVMVIIPWPPDLEPPGYEELPEVIPLHTPDETRRNPRKKFTRNAHTALGEISLNQRLKQLTSKRYTRAYHKARRVLARMQVPVICATEKDSVTLILDRIDRLRGLRRRR